MDVLKLKDQSKSISFKDAMDSILQTGFKKNDKFDKAEAYYDAHFKDSKADKEERIENPAINNLPKEYQQILEHVSKRFLYANIQAANLKKYYKCPLFVTNLLFRKYQLENVDDVIKYLNKSRVFESVLDRDLEPYIDLEVYTQQERNVLVSKM